MSHEVDRPLGADGVEHGTEIERELRQRERARGLRRGRAAHSANVVSDRVVAVGEPRDELVPGRVRVRIADDRTTVGSAGSPASVRNDSSPARSIERLPASGREQAAVHDGIRS